jgi:FtsP/CotA-like multicopper oxidase with cupredoxin domain
VAVLALLVDDDAAIRRTVAVGRRHIRFSDYPDLSTPYMFHCHLLEHEDRGMMGQLVVESERAPDSSPQPQIEG